MILTTDASTVQGCAPQQQHAVGASGFSSTANYPCAKYACAVDYVVPRTWGRTC